jgi:hypothetical protein
MTHAELVEMAQLCAFNARATRDERACTELWKMAVEYQEQAAQLDGGRKPFIGAPPRSLGKSRRDPRSPDGMN